MAGKITLADYVYKLDLDSDGFASGIKDTMSSFDGIKEKLSGITDMMGGSFKVGLAGVAAAVGAVAVAGIKDANELQKAMNDFSTQTGIAGESANQFHDALANIYAQNFGESFKDVADSMAEVSKTVQGLDASSVEELTKNALALRDTFDMDVSESVRAANTLMKNFGVTGDEAFNLIAQGEQSGLDYSGELLDSIDEYSVQFKKVGLDADDMFNIFAKGAESGAFNLDKVGDAVKEFSIRSIDGSKTTAQGFAAIGLSADDMAAKFGKGGETAKAAFQETMQALAKIKDPVAQNAAGVALFGTQWEDLGKEAVLALADTNGAISKTKDAMGEIKQIKYDDMGSAFTGIKRQLEVGLLLPIGEQLLPTLNKFANWLNEHMPQILSVVTSTFKGIGTVISAPVKAIQTLTDAFKNTSTTSNTTFGAMKSTVESAVNAISAIIKAFTALFKAIWDKWGDDIISAAKKTWDDVKAVFKAVFDILTAVFQAFADLFSGNWKAFGQDLLNIIKGVWDLIASVFKLAGQLLLDVASAAFELIKTAVMGILTGMYDAMKALFSAIGEWFKGVWDGLVTIVSGFADKFAGAAKTVFTALWNGAKEIFSSISTWVSQAWDGIVSTITGFGSKLYDAGAGIFTSLWDGLKSVWTNIESWVTDKVKWVADKFKNIKSDVASLFGETIVEVDMDNEGGSSSTSVNYNHIPKWVASDLEGLNGISSALASQQADMQLIIPNVTDYIQEQIDALQKENDEINKQLSYEQKLEALAKAKDQHTQRMYRDGEGYVWESNLDDVAKVQSDLAQAERESQVNALQKYKENWEDVLKSEQNDADAGKKAIADAVTARVLGTKWKEAVVAQQKDILDNFAKDYKKVCDQISANITALNEANAKAAQMAAWGDEMTKKYNLTDQDWNATAKFDEDIIQIPDMDSLASSASNLSSSMIKNMSTGWNTMEIAGVPRTTSDTINNSIKIGDIHLTGVQDADGLSKAIVKELPAKTLQAIYKR
ncbi:phage tail tape measure protein [Enterococcus sp.]|uniref:phage tail tape measure protein n=1 Tax=Enterococcus sp. TaxID=35783 RepID=UPI0028A130D5|nr:phage tail tape measure protein [Enterococcus sp.]